MGYGKLINGKYRPITPYKGSWADTIKGFKRPADSLPAARAITVIRVGPARSN